MNRGDEGMLNPERDREIKNILSFKVTGLKT
jgi:hypothetical protein